jgi:hypothetical protein
MRILAIALLVAGALALAYGGFSYTSETHDAKLGPVSISITEKERVNVPIWAGVALLRGWWSIADRKVGRHGPCSGNRSSARKEIRKHRAPMRRKHGNLWRPFW